jgi:hypothetical protein
MSKQVNQRDAEHYISTRQEFTASALSGKFEEYTPHSGRLDNEETVKLIEVFQAFNVYVVYSYGTPIAWHTEAGGWYIVGQKFSMTTSKHQNLVRRAANLLVV